LYLFSGARWPQPDAQSQDSTRVWRHLGRALPHSCLTALPVDRSGGVNWGDRDGMRGNTSVVSVRLNSSVPSPDAALVRDWLGRTVTVGLMAGVAVLLFAAGLAGISWALAPPNVVVIAGSFSTEKAADFASDGARVAAQRPVSKKSVGGVTVARSGGATGNG
jgi:hypothetical protein